MLTMDLLIPLLFALCVVFNLRAVFKLLVDWKGMRATVQFVKAAYARVNALPAEDALERDDRPPTFLHLVPAYQEPEITGTLRALLSSRYPHGKLHVVVVTKEEEERAPHPAMGISTGEVVRRFRAELPPYQQKMVWQIAMPGTGRKAHQLNWGLRPEFLREVLGERFDPARCFIGVSDADSLPDPNVYCWIAQEELAGRGAPAYQGVTLSLANFERLDLRGRVCAIQQSSIFMRVSIARLLNEVKRVRVLEALCRRALWAAWLIRPVFELFFRRSQICLGHNQFVRLDILEALGGFPTDGATEDSTLGYDLGMRGVLIRALPMLELTDLPETPEKVIRQNARWYKGVLDDAPHLWRAWRARPSAFNFAQVCRHVGNKVLEWPVAVLVYPILGFLGWQLAYLYREQPLLFVPALAFPAAALGLSIWVGGIVTQRAIEDLALYLPKLVEVRRRTLSEKFWGIFRCQTYWLLATRGAWRVLLTLLRTGRYEPAKTDRVIRDPMRQGSYSRS
ncbi:MAG: glycosyltransferase [Candidatus Rokubacteria bacterium]|nr:glycosyltransferase [Candidatus Rokubacteria bacterium]